MENWETLWFYQFYNHVLFIIRFKFCFSEQHPILIFWRPLSFGAPLNITTLVGQLPPRPTCHHATVYRAISTSMDWVLSNNQIFTLMVVMKSKGNAVSVMWSVLTDFGLFNRLYQKKYPKMVFFWPEKSVFWCPGLFFTR